MAQNSCTFVIDAVPRPAGTFTKPKIDAAGVHLPLAEARSLLSVRWRLLSPAQSAFPSSTGTEVVPADLGTIQHSARALLDLKFVQR